MQKTGRFDKARSSQYQDETTTFVHKTPTSVSQNIMSAIPFQQTPTQFSGDTVNRVVNHKINKEEQLQSNFQMSELPSERVSSQLIATQRIATFATQLNFQKKYEPFDMRDEDLVVLQQSQRDPVPVRNLTVETETNVYQDPVNCNLSQQSVGMVLAQNQYGTQKQALIQRKKKSSILYQKQSRNQADDNSPELTTTVLSNDRLDQQSEQSKAFSAAKPRRAQQSISKLSLTQRSHSSHGTINGTIQMNYYREKQKILQEINEQVRTSQAIQGRITSFKRQEEKSLKRMQNLERVYKYTEETRALRVESAERLKGLSKERAVWKKEKKRQVETVKFEIDLYKGIKAKEIEERKKEIVKSEKKVKMSHAKIRAQEKSIEIKKRQQSAERTKQQLAVALTKTQRFKIDLQSLHSTSRLENLEHYYKVAADDSSAVKKLEVIEAQALEKMQQTIKMETRHTERLMNRLENDKNHKAFFIAAVNDRSFDSEGFEKPVQKQKKQTSAQKSKSDVKWKWKP